MQSKLNSCLWLINHETLRNWEIPLLQRAGFTTIYTPQAISQAPGFTSGTVAPLEVDGSRIPARDLAILGAQDWYTKVDERASVVASRYFACAFVIADPRQVITVLKGFSGVVIIRLFGMDGNRTYSDLFTFSLSPHELSYFHRNLNRIIFASGYEELLPSEEKWIVDHSIFLPIGLPANKGGDFLGSKKDILAVIPRIEPESYYEQSFLKHTKMLRKANLKVAGRQHLTFEDKRILGSLGRADFEGLLTNCRAMIYASREKKHLHYHPLEAMQIGMPVVYFRDTLLHSVMQRSSLGSVKTNREARTLVRKMIKDRELALKIGAGQRELVLRMESQELHDAFIAACKTIKSTKATVIPEDPIAVIICTYKHLKSDCPALKWRPKKWLRFASIVEARILSEDGPEQSAKESLLNHESAISKVDGKSRHSRVFQFARQYYDFTWLAPDKYEIVLCDTSVPETLLTYCEVSRVLSKETCVNFGQSGKKSEIDALRYSLNSLDRIIVTDEASKDMLLAFTPTSDYLIEVDDQDSQ